MPLKKARLRISDYNQQRKQALRSRESRIRVVSLSLTSMVDMFAVLVIFLLLSTDDVTQWIDLAYGIELPQAKIHAAQADGATVAVAESGIYGDKELIVETEKVVKGPEIIAPLKAWLEKHEKKDLYVNVVAHKAIPFGAVRRILATCQDAGFGNVNLAVEPIYDKPAAPN